MKDFLLLMLLATIAGYCVATYLNNYITTGQFQPQSVTIGQCYQDKPDLDAPWEKPDQTVRLILNKSATKVLYVFYTVDTCVPATATLVIFQRWNNIVDCPATVLQCQKTYPNHIGDEWWKLEAP